MDQNCSSLSSSPGFIFGPTPMFHIPKFCIFYGAIKNWGQGGHTCCNLPEIRQKNPQKWQKLGFLALKTAATGQPMVQNWWNFGKNFFRSKPGCKPKISSVTLPGADWEAKRSKTHFFMCRLRRCIFPIFKAIFQKFRSRQNFWHPWHLCWLQFDRKKSNSKRCTKKCDPSSTGNWGFPL